LQIQTDIVDGVAIITLSGGAEYGTGDEVTLMIQRLLDEGHKSFVVNLERVKLIDSATLGSVVHGYTAVRRRGGVFRLEGVNERIRELLGLGKLTQLLVATLIAIVVIVSMIIWASR